MEAAAIDDLAPIPVKFHTDPATFMPYERDPRRSRARGRSPGRRASSTASAASRSRTCTGNISYDPINHEHMCLLRAEKVARIAHDIPLAEVHGAKSGRLLVLALGRHVRRDRGPPSAACKPDMPVG